MYDAPMYEAFEDENTPSSLGTEASTQELPMWIWGTTAFIAAYMLIQIQGLA